MLILPTVAPCVGAWIETCGAARADDPVVAPCVGAWIETSLLMTLYRTVTGRTLRGCVD